MVDSKVLSPRGFCLDCGHAECASFASVKNRALCVNCGCFRRRHSEELIAAAAAEVRRDSLESASEESSYEEEEEDGDDDGFVDGRELEGCNFNNGVEGGAKRR